MMSKSRVTAPAAFGIWAMDPGGTTGTACGTFLPQTTLAATLRAHAVEAEEWVGSTLDQAFDITNGFLEWVDRLLAAGIPEERIWFLSEAFELRTQRVDLSPVEVIAGTRALLGTEGWDIEAFQTASQAKQFATSARLRHWGLFRVGRGSDHKRDATRHLALGVARVLDGRMGS